MKNNTLIATFLLSIAVFTTDLSATEQHERAVIALDAENASYVVIGKAEQVSIITYGYKPANDTCKFLHDNDINALSVENYTSGKDGMLIITSKNC